MGKASLLGLRYCPNVRISQPTSLIACMTLIISCHSSPRPNIKPDFVVTSCTVSCNSTPPAPVSGTGQALTHPTGGGEHLLPLYFLPLACPEQSRRDGGGQGWGGTVIVSFAFFNNFR